MDEQDRDMTNVKDFGAVGDGSTDDTKAIRKAIDSLQGKGGVIFFPKGHYLTDTLYVPNSTTLMANPSWGYQQTGETVISPVKETQARLIDLNGKVAVRLTGLSLDGQKKGAEMCGVFASRTGHNEQNIVVDNCRIANFSGSGFEMNEAHVWCIRHSLFIYNGLDGVDAHAAFDGWIIDSMLVANGRYGLSLNNSTTVTANRIEHNGKAGLTCNRYFGQHLQIMGNLFCSEHGPSIELLQGNIRAISITGNTFRNSGRSVAGAPDRDCHVHLEGVQGLTMTGNVFHILWANNPSYALIVKNLQESVIANNTLFKGAMKALIKDLGGHLNCIMENNPGSLKDPEDLDS